MDLYTFSIMNSYISWFYLKAFVFYNYELFIPFVGVAWKAVKLKWDWAGLGPTTQNANIVGGGGMIYVDSFLKDGPDLAQNWDQW